MSELQTPSAIPVSSPGREYLLLKHEIDKAVIEVFSRGNYILGEEVSKFEEELAHYLHVRYAIGVASGTDAILLGLRAVGVGVGDEVIVPSHTAVASVSAIEQIGAIPVFCDISEDTLCINSEKILHLINSNTKAILVVHIYGHPARIEEIIKIASPLGIKIIEDCAQSLGAKIGNLYCGSFGDAAAFSFYPTKNLGALGDGGAVVTNSNVVSDSVRQLRQYGWRERNTSEIPGYNSRLDEVQAAVLRIKLKHLEVQNQRRRDIAKVYGSIDTHSLLKMPSESKDTLPSFHLYVVRTKKRESFQKFLKVRNIGTARHYPLAVHQQPAYQNRIKGSEDLFATEKVYKEIVSLPMFPQLSYQEIEKVVITIDEWVRSGGDVD